MGKPLCEFSSTYKKRPDLLCKISAPFLLRRWKTDPGIADDLPTKTIIDVSTHIGTTQASLYQTALTEKLAQIKHNECIQWR